MKACSFRIKCNLTTCKILLTLLTYHAVYNVIEKRRRITVSASWEMSEAFQRSRVLGRCRHDERNRSNVLYRCICWKVLLFFKVQPQEIKSFLHLFKSENKSVLLPEDALFVVYQRPSSSICFFISISLSSSSRPLLCLKYSSQP